MSFFGKKKEEEVPKGLVGIQTTGGRIDGNIFNKFFSKLFKNFDLLLIQLKNKTKNDEEIVTSMIEGANDPDNRVKNSISKSLVDVGKKQPNLVVSACADMLSRNPKVKFQRSVLSHHKFHSEIPLFFFVCFGIKVAKRSSCDSSWGNSSNIGIQKKRNRGSDCSWPHLVNYDRNDSWQRNRSRLATSGFECVGLVGNPFPEWNFGGFVVKIRSWSCATLLHYENVGRFRVGKP